MANLINLATQLAFGANSSPFGAYTTLSFTTTQARVLSQGVWLVRLLDVNTTLQYSADAGSNWITAATGTAAGVVVPCVFSDGFNVRLNQSTATATTASAIAQVKALF